MQSGRKMQPDSPRELRRYEALLEMADLMVHHRSLPELFHELAQRIQNAVEFQLLNSTSSRRCRGAWTRRSIRSRLLLPMRWSTGDGRGTSASWRISSSAR